MGAVQRLIASLRATPKKTPGTSASAIFKDGKKVGKTNVKMYRHWSAESEFVRSAIDIRKGQVSSADWDIVPYNPTKRYSKRLQQEIRDLFDTPNPLADSFNTFIEQVIEDVLVLDAGTIEIARSLSGKIRELYAIDGGEIRVSKIWDGDPDEARYFWWPFASNREEAVYLNKDIVYIMQRPATHRVVGLSNLEVLKKSIEAELWGSDYNARQVTSASGEGIFDLGESARPDQVEEFKSYWLAEIAGKGMTAFWGGTKGAKWIPFRNNNQDMQFMQWQEYLVKKIAAVFEMHAQDLQIANEVNKATSEVLDQQTEQRGARRLLKKTQSHLTREIVWDEGFGGKDNNLCFRFTRLNLRETLQNAEIDKIRLGGVAERSVNELRKDQGLEPYPEEHFDWPLAQSATGFVSLRDVPTARELMESKMKSQDSSNSDGPPA